MERRKPFIALVNVVTLQSQLPPRDMRTMGGKEDDVSGWGPRKCVESILAVLSTDRPTGRRGIKINPQYGAEAYTRRQELSSGKTWPPAATD